MWAYFGIDRSNLRLREILRRPTDFPVLDEDAANEVGPALDLLEDSADVFAHEPQGERIERSEEQDDKKYRRDP
jgi:hypothetical protein